MQHERIERFLEFLLIGVLMGVIEDLLAISLATDASFDARVLIIVVAVAIPFAAFSELIVDHPGFLHMDRMADIVHHTLKRDQPDTGPADDDG
jgi:heme/copper-type cytochrome/quinol oxidase subunit 4